MIPTTNWAAARPLVVIDPEARIPLVEKPARGPGRRLIEPVATLEALVHPWWRLPPGAALLLLGGMIVAALALVHEAVRAVELRVQPKPAVSVAPRGERRAKRHRHLSPRPPQRTNWSNGELTRG